MNRRQFIKGFFATLIAAQVIQLPGPSATPLGELSDYQKGRIIAEALKTSKGRDALAQSMMHPLRVQRNYQTIGRAAFQVQEMPQGALPIYDSDFDAAAYVVGDEGEKPTPETEEAIMEGLRQRRGRRLGDMSTWELIKWSVSRWAA